MVSATTHSSRSTNSLLAWVITLTAGLLFFYEFIQLNAMNSLSSSLIKNFKLDATTLGKISAMYFIANASLVFVAGNILDRFSPRKITIGATLLCIIGTTGFALAQNTLSLEISRFIVGIGGAFCFLCGLRIASRWFTPDKIGTVTGVLVTMAMLGGMLAQTPLTWLIEQTSWRHALLIDAGIGIIILLVMYVILEDSPESRTLKPHQCAQQPIITHIIQAIGKKQNWLGAAYSSCLNLPIFILGALWGNSYLQTIHGLSAERAATVCSMIFFGTVIGSPVAGFVSDRLQCRKLPMIAGAILSLGAIALLMNITQSNLPILMLAFFLLGLSTSTQIISYALVNESNSEDVTGTAVSMISMLILLGGAIFQPYFGQIVDRVKISHSLAYAYGYALWLLPIMIGIGLLLALFIRETHAKRKS